MKDCERVIIALDLETPEAAIHMARKIAPVFPFFKIGIKLFTAGGPELVRSVLHYGKVFLDLKFYDIPSIVADAAFHAAELGVSLLTIHSSGGSEMMKRSVAKVEATQSSVRLLGVTVLTSFSDLSEFGISCTLSQQVQMLARLSYDSGMDGVVCSAEELSVLRPLFPRPFLMVTPGIRGLKEEKGDQKRTASPSDAFQAGADYLVIGRPVIAAADPVAAAEEIARSIE